MTKVLNRVKTRYIQHVGTFLPEISLTLISGKINTYLMLVKLEKGYPFGQDQTQNCDTNLSTGQHLFGSVYVASTSRASLTRRCLRDHAGFQASAVGTVGLHPASKTLVSFMPRIVRLSNDDRRVVKSLRLLLR